jgi:hypothetical protein
MSTDPNQIALNDQQRQLLASAADQSGLPWQTLFEQAIVPLVVPAGSSNPERPFDALARLGLIGCIEGTPADLSTNKSYLDDLGRDG